MNLDDVFHNPAFKKGMAKLYGIGAAVVIIGALFKILHLPGATIALILGLGTEAVIFFISAFEPLHETPDWGLVYPELNGLEPNAGKGQVGGGGSELAALIQSGHLDEKDIQKLSEGIKKLSNTSSQLADLGDASVATNSYVQNMQTAGDAVGQFANQQISMAKSSESLANVFASSGETLKSHFESLTANNQSYGEQLSDVNKNLASINSAYELQLSGINSQVEASKVLTEGLGEISNQFQQSAGDAKVYREQVSQLSQSVSELNSIYGNMLSAMNMGNK
ncbi:gliding motility protein GldL [Carboxylicivirga sp. M1479]|uniref:type IX secretion system motor protein PorL/GldL n=1 Tax=Carboxylicivirga sp. M1479 TaxID=2594476 RepID=UPI0011774AC8|nr:gliding motility protein GldL [Carboxylicivirga sp. M1479]TRX61577.1 gliding motility protein GldL [Carboxylicivirga sp. M1479]